MQNDKFNFLAYKNQEKLELEYNLLLEKAMSIYFSSQKKKPSILIKNEINPEIKIFDLVTKYNFNNENRSFCISNLSSNNTRDWFRYLIKFFFDNKQEKFNSKLASIYFGKCFSLNYKSDRANDRVQTP